MNPARSGEYPRSCVRKRTRNERTIEPERLTRVEAKTIQTGRGRSLSPFQYFHIGPEVVTGESPSEFSEPPQQCRRDPGEQSQRAHETEDIEEDRGKGRAAGVVVRLRRRMRRTVAVTVHGCRARRAT